MAPRASDMYVVERLPHLGLGLVVGAVHSAGDLRSRTGGKKAKLEKLERYLQDPQRFRPMVVPPGVHFCESERRISAMKPKQEVLHSRKEFDNGKACQELAKCDPRIRSKQKAKPRKQVADANRKASKTTIISKRAMGEEPMDVLNVDDTN